MQAGVRAFFYLEDRERTLDSTTDKIMLSLTAFADELEREKARQRTTDAMVRNARAGHVTGGRLFGYDNSASCGCCGGTMRVRSRAHGARRSFFYGCSNYHERGRSVCTNNADIPMPEADTSVIEALLDDVLDASVLAKAVGLAVDILAAPVPANDRALEAERERLSIERRRLVDAITAGGPLEGLVSALKAREARLAELEAAQATQRAESNPTDLAIVVAVVLGLHFLLLRATSVQGFWHRRLRWLGLK